MASITKVVTHCFFFAGRLCGKGVIFKHEKDVRAMYGDFITDQLLSEDYRGHWIPLPNSKGHIRLKSISWMTSFDSCPEYKCMHDLQIEHIKTKHEPMSASDSSSSSVLDEPPLKRRRTNSQFKSPVNYEADDESFRRATSPVTTALSSSSDVESTDRSLLPGPEDESNFNTDQTEKLDCNVDLVVDESTKDVCTLSGSSGNEELLREHTASPIDANNPSMDNVVDGNGFWHEMRIFVSLDAIEQTRGLSKIQSRNTATFQGGGMIMGSAPDTYRYIYIYNYRYLWKIYSFKYLITNAIAQIPLMVPGRSKVFSRRARHLYGLCAHEHCKFL